jgi:hypothetical protein
MGNYKLLKKTVLHVAEFYDKHLCDNSARMKSLISKQDVPIGVQITRTCLFLPYSQIQHFVFFFKIRFWLQVSAHKSHQTITETIS